MSLIAAAVRVWKEAISVDLFSSAYQRLHVDSGCVALISKTNKDISYKDFQTLTPVDA